MSPVGYETEPQFHMETQSRESRNVLILAGRIGLDASAQLHDMAEHLAASSGDVDIDWRKMETTTAGCLQVLLALGVTLSERGRNLVVTGDSPDVRRILELAGLSGRFPVQDGERPSHAAAPRGQITADQASSETQSFVKGVPDNAANSFDCG